MEIFLADLVDRGEAPSIALYATRSLTGTPVVSVSGAGLFLRGNLVCSWPGGRFDGSSLELMVLGYADKEASDYRGCPRDLPIKSYWSYHDGREPSLSIEVNSRRGSLIEVRHGSATYYFDLNALQGDPVVRGEAMDRELSRVIRRKGFTAWNWAEPARDIERRETAALARLQQDSTFVAFTRNAKDCLLSSAVPTCFVPFVRSNLYVSGSKDGATPGEIVDFIWRESDRSGRRRWDDLVACFTIGRMSNAYETGVQFQTEHYLCDVERVGSRWQLASFVERP